MNKSYQNFKKRAGKLAVALTLVGTTVAGGMAIGADGVDAATVKSGYASTAVYLRKSASTKSAKLATIKKGAKVTILKTSGKWLKVKYNGKTGYVYKTYVKKTFTTKDYSGKFKLKTDLNVRKGPGTSFVKAGTLKKGTVVTVKGKTSNGWYTITYKGATRYISASSKYLTKYVAPTPTPQPDPTPEKPSTNTKPVIAVDSAYQVKQNGSFKYSDLKATAFDKEDGELKISYSGEVDTKTVGKYKVTLTVTDSDKNTTTKEVVVSVVRNLRPMIKTPYSQTGYVVEEDKPFDVSDLKVTVSDVETPDDVTVTYTIKDNAGKVIKEVPTYKPGKFTVKINAVDGDGVEAYEVNVPVEVVQDKAPTLNFKYDAKFIESKSSVLKVDKGTDTVTVEEKEDFTISDLKQIFNAVATDGYTSVVDEHDITNSIEVITTEAKLKDMLSKPNESGYDIKFQVSDNNKAKFKTVKLIVKANNKPEIRFDNNRVTDAHHADKYDKIYRIPLNQKFNVAELKASVKDINAATGKENPGVKLESNIYDNEVKTNQVGTTVLTFKATDNKGAESVVKVAVEVYDYKDNASAPVITFGEGTKVVNDVLEIQCEENKTMTLGEIKDMVKAVATDEDGKAPSMNYQLFDTKYNPDKPLNDIDAGVLGYKYTFRITATDNGDSQGQNQKTTVKDVTIVIVNK